MPLHPCTKPPRKTTRILRAASTICLHTSASGFETQIYHKLDNIIQTAWLSRFDTLLESEFAAQPHNRRIRSIPPKHDLSLSLLRCSMLTGQSLFDPHQAGCPSVLNHVANKDPKKGFARNFIFWQASDTLAPPRAMSCSLGSYQAECSVSPMSWQLSALTNTMVQEYVPAKQASKQARTQASKQTNWHLRMTFCGRSRHGIE